jgi:hypothetical protein
LDMFELRSILGVREFIQQELGKIGCLIQSSAASLQRSSASSSIQKCGCTLSVFMNLAWHVASQQGVGQLAPRIVAALHPWSVEALPTSRPNQDASQG